MRLLAEVSSSSGGEEEEEEEEEDGDEEDGEEEEEEEIGEWGRGGRCRTAVCVKDKRAPLSGLLV